MPETNKSWLSSKLEAFLEFATGTNLNRIGRLKYLSCLFIFELIMGVVTSLCLSICSYIDGLLGIPLFVIIFGLILAFLSIYGNVYIYNKRLHDFGHSGWWQLLLFIPVVNLIFLIVICCVKGDDGENQYGAASETKRYEKVIAWIYIIAIPVLCFVGVFAAALLPRLQSAQSTAVDATRKADLSSIHSAIISYFNANGSYPLDIEAENGIETSALKDVLKSEVGFDVPSVPGSLSNNYGLGSVSSSNDYLYMVTTKNTIVHGGFVLMAAVNSASNANWVVCDNGEGVIEQGYDLKNFPYCYEINKASSCSNNNGVCTYSENSQLRYVDVY